MFLSTTKIFIGLMGSSSYHHVPCLSQPTYHWEVYDLKPSFKRSRPKSTDISTDYSTTAVPSATWILFLKPTDISSTDHCSALCHLEPLFKRSCPKPTNISSTDHSSAFCDLEPSFKRSHPKPTDYHRQITAVPTMNSFKPVTDSYC